MLEIEFFQARHGDGGAAGTGCWPHDDGLLLGLATDVGNGAAGFATQLALDVIAREMERAPGAWPVAKRLRRAVQEVNLDLHGKALVVPELHGTAAALTASVIAGGLLVTAHVGTSRLVLVRDGRPRQLTKDHTGPFARALGPELVVAVDVLRIAVRTGDVVAHVSDGLWALVREAEIAELLVAHRPEGACRALVRRAREEGAERDVAVQVAAVTAAAANGARPWWRLGG
ncbi:MAG TPA: protein phosphatase 2C domain-containing protein [Candidatus Binatia bacterium]|nr:protein phosphatase 2C domain-containing protein [Candidatus Binatia bacterium]